MKLYLLRHATAATVAASDADRPLTKEGEAEARIVGTALSRLKITPGHTFSSPLLRAEQTARIVAGKFDTLVELANNTSTPALLRALHGYRNEESLLLVGHMPSLAEHLAALIGAGHDAGLSFGKAGIACVELPELQAGKGELRWLLRQKQLRLIAV
jgi:phosphohistidine phosphatase